MIHVCQVPCSFGAGGEFRQVMERLVGERNETVAKVCCGFETHSFICPTPVMVFSVTSQFGIAQCNDFLVRSQVSEHDLTMITNYYGAIALAKSILKLITNTLASLPHLVKNIVFKFTKIKKDIAS